MLPSAIVSYVPNCYSHLTAYVSTADWNTAIFQICRGVLQGDPLSLLLFNLAINLLLAYLLTSGHCGYFARLLATDLPLNLQTHQTSLLMGGTEHLWFNWRTLIHIEKYWHHLSLRPWIFVSISNLQGMFHFILMAIVLCPPPSFVCLMVTPSIFEMPTAQSSWEKPLVFHLQLPVSRDPSIMLE